MTMTRSEFETQLIAEARTWHGVGFLNNGRTKSQGTDCIGLVFGVYGALGITPSTPPSAYRLDWYKHTYSEPYFDALMTEGKVIPRDRLAVGDILLFVPGRLIRGGSNIAHHVGLYLGGDRFIHCRNGRGVEETDLGQRAWAQSYAEARRLRMVIDLLGEVS